MKLLTAKRRINKTLDELTQSVIDDWYANFKSGYVRGYEDARQGKAPMYAEAYKVADTPQADDIGDCNSCEHLGELRCGMCTNGSGYKRIADTPQTERPSCDTCKHNELEWFSEVCDECIVGKDKPSNYEPKQTDCPWK